MAKCEKCLQDKNIVACTFEYESLCVECAEEEGAIEKEVIAETQESLATSWGYPGSFIPPHGSECCCNLCDINDYEPEVVTPEDISPKKGNTIMVTSFKDSLYDAHSELFNKGMLVCREAQRQAKNPSRDIFEGAMLLWDDGLAMEREALAIIPLWDMYVTHSKSYHALLRLSFNAKHGTNYDAESWELANLPF